MPGYIDTAKVLVLPDLGRFGTDLKRQLDTAFQGVKRQLNDVAKQIEQPFSNSAKVVADTSSDAMNAFRMATAGVADDSKRSMSEVEKVAKDSTTKTTGHFTNMRQAVGRQISSITAPIRSVGATVSGAFGRVRTTISNAFAPLQELGPKVSSALTNIGDHVSGVTDRINTMAATAGRMSLIGGAAFTALGGAAAFMGIKTLAAQQNAAIGFEVLVGSTRKAQALLKQLFDFAKITPFELPQVQQAAQLLLGAGSKVNDLKTQLTALGNAASVTVNPMDSFGRITLALSQAMNRGKLQGQDLLQVVEAGVPVWRLLSEALHKPIPEIQKMSEQGKLLATDVMPKLFAQMNKDYGGAMTKQSATLTGMWSTFMDTLNFGLADVVRPFQEDLNNVLAGAIQKVNGVTARLADKTSDLHKRWETFKQALPDVWARVREGVGVVGGLVDKMGGLGGIIRRVSAGLLAFNLIKLGAMFGPWGVAIGAVVGALILLWSHTKTVRDTVQSVGNFFKNSLAPVFHMFGDMIERFVVPQLRGLRAAWHDNSTAIKGLMTGPIAGLLRIIGVVLIVALNVLVRSITSVITIVGAMGRAINFLWRNVVQPVTRFVVNAFLTMASGIITGAAKAFGWVPGIGPKLKAAAKTFGNFKDDVNRALDKIKDKTVDVTAKGGTSNVTFSVKGTKILAQARGGIHERPTVAMVGEGRAPETVIPWDPAYRSRALGLWSFTGRKLGVPGFAEGGVLPAARSNPSALEIGAGRWNDQLTRAASVIGDRLSRQIGAIMLRKIAIFPPHVAGGWTQVLGFLRGLGIAFNVISGFRPGARTHASGAVSFHALNRAVDLGGNFMQIFNALSRTNPTELIYSRAPYYVARGVRKPIGQLDPITRADHYNHVHVAYARGLWRAAQDHMAWIHRDEMVLPPGPAESVRSGGGFGAQTIVNVNVDVYAAPGMDEEQIGRQVTKQVTKAFDDRDRLEAHGARR